MAILSPEDVVECVRHDPDYGYQGRVDNIRREEYGNVGDTIYLDHAGATLYPTSIINEHAKELTSNLFSNPHSRSPSSVATTARISKIRLRVLGLFKANPELFDVIFVANATAGIKLVADGFSGGEVGFRYKYLRDVHTSLVGVSALAQKSKCLSESETARWLKGDKVEKDQRPGLFAYPAQSNFNGRRFPLEWIQQARRRGWYSLLDAASYLTTTPLDYSDASTAPDFTVLSFYKIFGYPDLGAIVVRRDAGHILLQRRYFGGGTRAAITSDSFHAARPGLHDALEDGTLPFHTILALDSALNSFFRLYGSLVNISRHAAIVSRLMFTLLSSLRHHNGRRVCQLYSSSSNSGPIIAFNLISADGSPIGFASFEQLSSLRNIALRTGGMCNPGGVEQCLNLQDLEIKRNFEAGKVCGDDMDVVAGKNTGVIRVSFGACSIIEDVTAFVDFIKEFYVEKEPIAVMNAIEPRTSMTIKSVHLCITTLNPTLTTDPIKSCHAYSVPQGVLWPVTSHGVLYDREFFLMNAVNGRALSQKQHPRMALIKPSINLETKIMSVSSPASPALLEIPLDIGLEQALVNGVLKLREDARVCADTIRSLVYTSQEIRDFFSAIVGVDCSLALYHPLSSISMRFFKADAVGSQSITTQKNNTVATKREIWLSNESPFLLISQPSVDALSQSTPQKSKISPAVFRPNFVLEGNRAYAEDSFRRIRIGDVSFDILGQCRRCHMVCVDPEKGVKEKQGSDVYLGLGKTRKKDTGGVVFGIHMGLNGGTQGFVQVGDPVVVEEFS